MNKSVSTVVAIIGTLLISACQPGNVEPTSGQPAIEVTVAPVVYETIVEWDEYTGKIESPETVDLTPRVSGYVTGVMFSEGAIVNEGDVLFEIDSAIYRAEVKRLEAELKAAESALQLAKTNHSRAERLINSNVIPERDYDRVASDFSRAAAQVDSVMASLERARIDLSYTQVRSPISGRASRAEVTSGNYVVAGQSLLTQIVSVAQVHAYFQADETAYLKYAHMAAAGTRPSSREVTNPVLMSLADDRGYVFQGVMDFVDNRVDPASGTVTGRAVFDNTDGLLIPGLFTRLRLLGTGAHEAVLIDDRAIQTDLGKRYVLVLNEDSVVEYREVDLGAKVHGLRVITNGLDAGDKIVVRGIQRVRPGSEVIALESSMTNDDVIAAIRAEVQSSYANQMVAKI